MIEYLMKDSLFYIVPEDIDHAGVFSIEKFDDNSVTLTAKGEFYYSPDEIIEVFVNAKKGILYFKTVIINCSGNTLTISMPKEYELLQRRENQRILVNEPITIKNDSTEEKATIVDLSAGGMKIITDHQISMNSQYNVILDFDNLYLDIFYIPQRLSVTEEGDKENYSISGQIVTRTQNDKIELAQYCYKKSYEQSNRK